MAGWFEKTWRCRICGRALASSYSDCARCLKAPNAFERQLIGLPPDVQFVRDDAFLYARFDAVFPDRCVMTSAPTTNRSAISCHVENKYLGGFNGGRLAAFAGILFVIVMSMIVPQSAPFFFLGFGILTARMNPAQKVLLRVPLCDEVLSRRRSSTLSCMAAFAGASMFYPLSVWGEFYGLIPVGVAIQMGICVLGVVRLKELSITESVAGFFRIKGVSKEFLNSVPEISSRKAR